MAEARKEKTKKVEKKQEKEEKRQPIALYLGVIIVVVVIIAALLLFTPSSLSNVSFSSFKQNFNVAPRVALVSYYNASGYAEETTCTTALVEILASHRNPATIDFFTIQNNTCTFIPNGIGHPGNLTTTNSSACLSTAASEPSISLNYSSFNRTVVTPDHLNIFGDSSYMQACPIAVDLS